ARKRSSSRSRITSSPSTRVSSPSSARRRARLLRPRRGPGRRRSTKRDWPETSSDAQALLHGRSAGFHVRDTGNRPTPASVFGEALAGSNTATNCKHSWFRVLRARACFLRYFLQGVGYGDADGKQERVRPGPDGRRERLALGRCSLVGVGTAAQGEERRSAQALLRHRGAGLGHRPLANQQGTLLVKNRGAGTQGRKGFTFLPSRP